jgi:hypothetical protein
MQTLEDAIFVKYSACLFTLGKFLRCKSESCNNLVFGELDWVSIVGPCEALPGRPTRVCVTIHANKSDERVEVMSHSTVSVASCGWGYRGGVIWAAEHQVTC